MTIFSSGISMYALGLLFQLVLGWSFTSSVLLSAAIVLIYTFLGGLTSAIYNEVLQFFLIVLGFAPLAILGGQQSRRLAGHGVAASPDVMTHSWKYIGDSVSEPDGRRGLRHGRGSGLRSVLRLLVHRLPGRAARHGGRIHVGRAQDAADRRVSEDVHAVHRHRAGHRGTGPDARWTSGYALPAEAGGGLRLRSGADHSDGAVLSLGHARRRADGADGIVHVGHGGQRDGLQYRFTYDIYQSYIQRNAPDSHYLTVGRITTVVGIALVDRDRLSGAALQQHHGLAAAGVRLRERAAVRHVPAWHVLEAHHRPRRISSGCCRERLLRPLTHGLTVAEGKGGWLGDVHHEFPSTMAQNFWIAIFAWTTCFVVTIVVSLVTRPKAASELHNLVYGLTDVPHDSGLPWYKRPGPLAIVVAVLLTVLNVIFW